MSLAETYRSARSLEAVENYALTAGSILHNIEYHPRTSNNSSNDRMYDFFDYSDEYYWDFILKYPEESWGKKFAFGNCAISQWVARVPGLYWTSAAKALRRQGRAAPVVEYGDIGRTYQPATKSLIVSGGVGTLKFPPDNAGHQLVTLSIGHNASSGVPAIISPEVWEYHQLGEGDVVNSHAYWQKMTIDWAQRFTSIRGIPRGYLIISDPRQIEVLERRTPTQFHPCTIMEYSTGDAILYDFVYAGTTTSVENHRQKLETFFEEYKKKDDRYGRYLLAAEINAAYPLWHADYMSPEELYAEQGGKSQLFLLQERMYAHSFKGHTMDDLIRALARNFDNNDLQEISRDIAIPPSHWFAGASAANSATQFLEICLRRKKVDELIDALARKNPALFIS